MALSHQQLIGDLRDLIRDWGRDGGIISPSVYDTAQVLRFSPPAEGVKAALGWLMSQQQPDGGWGDPAVPLARDIPTLAAILALLAHSTDLDVKPVVDAGLDYLREGAAGWTGAHIDLVPIAAEMILPQLLDDACRMGLHIDRAPYRRLFELSRRKRQALAAVKLVPGSGPTYSWEALGLPFDESIVDAIGSVGHSPSATAFWLDQARACEGASPASLDRAEEYLCRAAAATGCGIPGVVPTVWPIPVFEEIYGLYAFALNGLMDNEIVRNDIKATLDHVDMLLARDAGLSFSEHFVTDVDCTSVGALAIALGGRTFDAHAIEAFKHDDHFYTFQGELNPSVFSNAHALHALSLRAIPVPDTEQYLLGRELPQGGWLPDKWHSSWIYTSLEVCTALQDRLDACAAGRLKARLLAEQMPCGGWGRGQRPSMLETSYALMLMDVLDEHVSLSGAELQALAQGRAWLQENYDRAQLADEKLWMGKELYAPFRVDAAYVLSVLIGEEHATSTGVFGPLSHTF